MDFITSAASIYAEDTLSVLQFTSMVDSTRVDFMAFLTTFTQAFNSTWTSEQVYGRNDPIANFQGTQRTVSLGWDLPAANLEEAKKNMQKISSLTKMMYPGYSQAEENVESSVPVVGTTGTNIRVGSNALSLSKAPLIRLKFANLLNSSVKGNADGLLGYVGNLSANPTLDMGMFSENSAGEAKLYPKVYSLSIDFTVLHEHDLGRTIKGENSFPDSPSFPFGG